VEGPDKGLSEALGLDQGVFVGSFTHSLDPKKRMTVPSEWREQVGSPGSLYVLPGVDKRCLYVFPAREMVKRVQRLLNHPVADARARQFSRVLGSQSQLVPWDAQGRIRVKDELLGWAGITTQVVLVGVFGSFEVWSPELWKEAGSLTEASLADAAQYVGF